MSTSCPRVDADSDFAETYKYARDLRSYPCLDRTKWAKIDELGGGLKAHAPTFFLSGLCVFDFCFDLGVLSCESFFSLPPSLPCSVQRFIISLKLDARSLLCKCFWVDTNRKKDTEFMVN